MQIRNIMPFLGFAVLFTLMQLKVNIILTFAIVCVILLLTLIGQYRFIIKKHGSLKAYYLGHQVQVGMLALSVALTLYMFIMALWMR